MLVFQSVQLIVDQGSPSQRFENSCASNPEWEIGGSWLQTAGIVVLSCGEAGRGVSWGGSAQVGVV